MSTVRIGLIQTRGGPDKSRELERECARIREAAAAGARIICLKELFNTPYFCTRQDVDLFDLAEPLPGPTTDHLSALARELEVVLIVPVFERSMAGVTFNSAAVIDADGTVIGKYRKTHIPQDPGFEEKFYFAPGDLGYQVWNTRYAKIGVLICWDQWYPEAARITALKGAQILFYPTAIGWLPEEKASLGAAQHNAWETVQRGHAVANGCFVAAVNRVGTEDGTEFWGQSFVSNPYGEVMVRGSEVDEEVLLADCDLQALEDFRRIWPFFRDRRTDLCADLQRRVIEES
jgi:N-carbamoylputrescine amidase